MLRPLSQRSPALQQLAPLRKHRGKRFGRVSPSPRLYYESGMCRKACGGLTGSKRGTPFRRAGVSHRPDVHARALGTRRHAVFAQSDWCAASASGCSAWSSLTSCSGRSSLTSCSGHEGETLRLRFIATAPGIESFNRNRRGPLWGACSVVERSVNYGSVNYGSKKSLQS